MSRIQTYTGRRFYPLDPRPEDVSINDIAHALSLICRWTGHVPVHLSVAQHSIYVCDLLPPRLKIYGLLHDAGEAYLADVARPIKAAFPTFRSVERGVLHAVFKAFGLPIPSEEDWAEVMRADSIVLATEARDLMGGSANWSDLPEPMEQRIVPMEAGGAEEPFLRRFEALMNAGDWWYREE